MKINEVKSFLNRFGFNHKREVKKEYLEKKYIKRRGI